MNSKASSKPGESSGQRRVAQFAVDCRVYIGADGKPVADLPAFADEPEIMKRLYRQMVLSRVFDEKAIALQRTGRLGTYASLLGQEAVGVGVASAMDGDDVLLPSFREHAAQLVRGVSLKELFLYWGGDERGSDFAGPRHDFPVSIPVATHLPHATGAALALKLLKRPGAAVAMAGDGATSKGEFYEAINMAGAWQLPAVFVISNNGWAISVPRAAQSRAETLAQKAAAAGIPGEQVDGNDVVAVRQAVSEAITRARAGQGPCLIEALTYRLGDHTTADDARRYRDDAEVSRHWKEEPIARLRAFMTAAGWWSKDDEQALLAACSKEVAAAAEAYLATPPQSPETMFAHLYARLPSPLEGQLEELRRAGEAGDG
jgi:2-oxoisovalerate dehydrogenase E1 component alpha subunit